MSENKNLGSDVDLDARKRCQKCGLADMVDVYQYRHIDEPYGEEYYRFYYKCNRCNKKYVRDFICSWPPRHGRYFE